MTPLERVRAIAMALPSVEERLSHGSPAWFITRGKCIAMYVHDHHGDGHVGIWVGAPSGVQGMLVAEDPSWFFVPPYVGGRGWVGVDLDKPFTDWDRVEQIVTDSYRLYAPARLLKQL